MTDPFKIIEPTVLTFSGGRTSAYMLWRVLQVHGGKLPDDAIAIFEIKSSTIENYKDQAFKGCNQLAEYALNLSGKKSKDVLKFLILEVPYGGGVDIEYVSDICKLMNVTTIDFYFDKEWPDRCVLDFGSWTTLRSKLPQP